MIPRFYAPHATVPGAVVSLSDDEAGHLMQVLRLGAGAAVAVFDGRGREFEACVEAAGKSGVTVRLGAPRTSAPEAAVAVTLAQAVLKGDKMDDVVRDAVMMGVAAIQPVVTTRSEISLGTIDRGHRRERWERIAIASAKQCGRAVVPEILAPREFSAVIDALKHHALPGPGLMFVEPSVATEAVGIIDLELPPPRETTVMIGPEGGWSRQEIEDASGLCRMVTLGKRTLRADAMPIVALAALFTVWRQF